jgi:hypothetical protein
MANVSKKLDELSLALKILPGDVDVTKLCFERKK